MAKNSLHKITAEELVARQLEFIGEDVKREGLLQTPRRVARSWATMFSGYRAVPLQFITSFEEGACKEMVVLRNAEFYSTCEHHLLPFYGTVSIGYLPTGKVIGVSKMVRLVEALSRRLQIQERLTTEIADCLQTGLEPAGVMVICKARHLCMMARGVRSQHAEMVTSAIRGVFEKPEVRMEFLELLK